MYKCWLSILIFAATILTNVCAAQEAAGQIQQDGYTVSHCACHFTDTEGWFHTIHIAARSGCVRCVTAWLEAGNVADLLDQNACTPLHKTALKGAVDAARVLIDHGADPEAKDRRGNAPLFYAVNHVDYVLFLLGNGADIDMVINNNRSRTLLKEVAMRFQEPEVDHYGKRCDRPQNRLRLLAYHLLSRFAYVDSEDMNFVKALSMSLDNWKDVRHRAATRLKNMFNESTRLPEDKQKHIICNIVLTYLCTRNLEAAESRPSSGVTRGREHS